MSEIQERAEAFRVSCIAKRQADDFMEILRSAVKECLTIDGAALFILAIQHIKRKREKFAWLLEGKNDNP